MKSYSQNREDLFIADYFGNGIGNLLDIGANDGTTFSNSRLLIEQGWHAHLFEPGSIYSELHKLYKENTRVAYYNVGIGDEDKIMQFHESGAHVKGGSDRGLVSTTDYQETLRWPDAVFTEKNIQLWSFESAWHTMGCPQLLLISIDVEGMEYEILQQIDLDEVGCKVLCIEWNSKPKLLKLFSDYCKDFTIAVKNAENLIFTI